MTTKRIGELTRSEGTDLHGSYIRIRFGNFEDVYRRADTRWYRSERNVRPMPRCQVRDDEALPELNRLEKEITST